MGRWWDQQAAGGGDDGSPTLESMPLGLMELDTDWVVRFVNAAGERAVGYRREELIGRSFWEAFPANVDSDFGRVYREAVATGEPATVEAFYPEPLNQWFEVNAVPNSHGLWLYFTEVTTRRQVQERLAVLAQVGDVLAGTLDAEAAAGDIPRLVVPGLGSWATISVLDPQGNLVHAGASHVQPSRAPLVQRWATESLRASPLTAPLLRAVHTGTPVTLTGPELTGPALDQVSTGAARELLELLEPGSMTVLPLRGRDRVLGALTLVADKHRTLTAADRATALEVAARAGLALDNARLFDQQRRLAEELQRSMLTPPPEPDHAQVVVRYLPATEAAQVGGDWYDAFMQPGGATTLVIGDVVGHDTAAAAAMGQLRSMLRGIAAVDDTGPAQLLTKLDGAITQLQLHTLATVALARFEQTPEEIDRGVTRMRWANAGHPSPLVIHPDGSLAALASWHGELMLGVDPTTTRTESVVTLDRGTTVLLYTDGLVERRTSDLDDGQRRLREAASELAHLSLDELCDQLMARLVEDDHDDDVALVAIRLHRQDRPRPDEAGPQNVPPTVPADQAPTQ